MRRILFPIVALVPFTDEFLSTIRRASSVLLPASIADYHGNDVRIFWFRVRALNIQKA